MFFERLKTEKKRNLFQNFINYLLSKYTLLIGIKDDKKTKKII